MDGWIELYIFTLQHIFLLFMLADSKILLFQFYYFGSTISSTISVLFNMIRS